MNGDLTSVRLKVEGLSKSFHGVQVLQDVSFEARGGKVLAVVGENGSGKSTTMNLLTGVLRPDSGRILLDGATFEPRSRRESNGAGIAFIQQELNVFGNLSVTENLFLANQIRLWPGLPFIARKAARARAKALLRQVELDVSPDTLAGALSAGERQLVEIARGLSADARVFILDEPTSSLTGREKARLFEIIHRLRERDVAILFISHDLDDVMALADDVLVMRDGRTALHACASTLTPQDLVLAMVGRSIDALFPERLVPPGASPLLEVRGLGQPGVLHDVHLGVSSGEILGIAGLMGSGRSELARAVFGLDEYSVGSVRIGDRQLESGDLQSRLDAGMAFLTEDRRREGLMMDASVADNVALAALPLFAARGRIESRSLLEAVRTLSGDVNLKSGDLAKVPVRTLSGGNQQKVVLCRWLLRKPCVFILDEPTRGVDIGAKQEIYRLLTRMAAEGMGILIISSELDELVGLCDRILVMRRGQLQAEFPRERFDREMILRAAFGQDDAA